MEFGGLVSVWGQVGSAAMGALAVGAFAFLVFRKSDDDGLAAWLLLRDPRWRYRLIFIGILAVIVLAVFWTELAAGA